MLEHLRGQLVETAAVASVEPAAPAGEQQGLVADAADPVLRLPPAAALDREARSHGMVDAEPEQVVCRCRRRLRQVDRGAEEEPEPRSTRTEGGGGREREVDLEAAREQEDAVDRGSGGKVEEVDAVEVGGDPPRPVSEDVVERHRVRDGEREVEVGPAVAGAVGEAAHDGCRDHARIGLGQREHVVADAVAVLDAEHPPIVADPPRAPPARPDG